MPHAMVLGAIGAWISSTVWEGFGWAGFLVATAIAIFGFAIVSSFADNNGVTHAKGPKHG
ncbi:MAG: hypothetical protein RIC55_09420 [Pirellulaceae bacterium]